MSIWRRLLGRKQATAEHGKTSAPGGKGTTIVALSDDSMEYFRRHGGSAEALDAAARDYLGKGKYEDSFRCCRILSMIYPNVADPWLGAGIALYEKDAATWQALIGQKISKSKPPPYDGMCEAVKYLDKALELDPDNHLAWYYKGSSLAMIGQFTQDAPKVRQGLECFSQALRTRPGDDATKKAIRGFQNLYGVLQGTSTGQREAEAVCDVCNFPINFADGYSLITKQIVTTVQYWEVVLKGQYRRLLSDDQDAMVALGQLIVQQASQSTGWLVCEACADLFQFDRVPAKNYARKRMSPPGAGPLEDPQEALAPAFVARLNVKEGKGA